MSATSLMPSRLPCCHPSPIRSPDRPTSPAAPRTPRQRMHALAEHAIAPRQPMTSKTTVVTVTYGDGLYYLQQMIERAQSFAEISVVLVVSNASSAQLYRLLERWPDPVRLIELQQNTDSAKGYAVELEAALTGGADN